MSHLVVISGAFGYVGKSIAKELAQKGFSLVLLSRSTPQSEIDEFISTCKGVGNIYTYTCDLTKEQEVVDVLQKINNEHGPVYACIHAAGIAPMRKSLLQAGLGELQVQLQGNLVPGFNLLTHCAQIFKKQGSGLLIGITTIGVVHGEATTGMGSYIIAKYGLQGLLAALRQELLQFGVRVYSIAPGFMPEGMNASIPRAFVEMIKSKNKSGKLTTADDVAARISRVLTESSEMYTELTIPVSEEYQEK